HRGRAGRPASRRATRMGRFFGRRPDRTPAMARFRRSHLEPGERVIAGGGVETPGTAGAAQEGGTSGAVGAAVGNLPPAVGRDDGQRAAGLDEATAMGIDPGIARSLVHCAVVLTSARLIVLRRSSLTRRLDRIAFAWPVEEVDRIEVPR